MGKINIQRLKLYYSFLRILYTSSVLFSTKGSIVLDISPTIKYKLESSLISNGIIEVKVFEPFLGVPINKNKEPKRKIELNM